MRAAEADLEAKLEAERPAPARRAGHPLATQKRPAAVADEIMVQAAAIGVGDRPRTAALVASITNVG